MAALLLMPAEAAAVVADELANKRLVPVVETLPLAVCAWSGGEPDRLRSPPLPLRLVLDPQAKLSCCMLPIVPTPDVAATIDFFLPVAPKLKNLFFPSQKSQTMTDVCTLLDNNIPDA